MAPPGSSSFKHVSFFLLSFSIIISSISYLPSALYASSSVFTYNSITGSLGSQQPPVLVNGTSAEGATYTFAPTYTSGITYIQTSNKVQLLYNPDFYNSPDGWYCSATSSFSCYWLPSDPSAVSSGGVILVGGSSSTLWEYAVVDQEIYIPSGVTISSATAEVRARIEVGGTPLAYYLIVGLYDPITNSVVSYYYVVPSNTYNTYTFDFTLDVSPGSRYVYFAGVSYIGFFGFGATVNLYIDRVFFNLTTTENTFSNNIYVISSSQGVYSFLSLISTNASTGFSATLYLNNGTITSTPIKIVNGAVVFNQTSTIYLPASSSGYNSGYVKLNITKTSPDSVVINLYLVYCTGVPFTGACIYYPLKIHVDPASLSLGPLGVFRGGPVQNLQDHSFIGQEISNSSPTIQGSILGDNDNSKSLNDFIETIRFDNTTRIIEKWD